MKIQTKRIYFQIREGEHKKAKNCPAPAAVIDCLFQTLSRNPKIMLTLLDGFQDRGGVSKSCYKILGRDVFPRVPTEALASDNFYHDYLLCDCIPVHDTES